jgi:predicted RNA binding protein YcfA (HicA-like mRNA interferase family)
VAPHNVRFGDVVRLAEALGFRVERIEGSHHILIHPNIPELLNLQEVKGEVKPYQVRQLLQLIERYNLTLGEEA